MAGEHIDISSSAESQSRSDASAAGRRFVGIQFACCHVYSRVYVNHEESAYVGHCPRCRRRVQLRIGPEGTNNRFFTAY